MTLTGAKDSHILPFNDRTKVNKGAEVMNHAWVQGFEGGITVCDPEGTITEMNDRAAQTYRNIGGRNLLGRNLFDCHPEPARTKLSEIMKNRMTHAYTVEIKGVRKLLYQAPWYENGEYRGFVEISLPLPSHIPHYNRDQKTPDKP